MRRPRPDPSRNPAPASCLSSAGETLWCPGFGEEYCLGRGGVDREENGKKKSPKKRWLKSDWKRAQDSKSSETHPQDPYKELQMTNALWMQESGVQWELCWEGPTRKPWHTSVFSTHSDTQAVPAVRCMQRIFSTRPFLNRNDTLSTSA